MKILLTALSAALLSSVAVAGEEAASARVAVTTFETLDKNGDRQISRTEATAEKALSDSFAIVDTDGDGYVTQAEYMARSKS